LASTKALPPKQLLILKVQVAGKQGVFEVNEKRYTKRRGKLLRLWSRFRPRIRPQYTNQPGRGCGCNLQSNNDDASKDQFAASNGISDGPFGIMAFIFFLFAARMMIIP
jgi:hypothetical protein